MVESSESTGCVPRDINEQLPPNSSGSNNHGSACGKRGANRFSSDPNLYPLISTDTRVDGIGPVLFALTITRAELNV